MQVASVSIRAHEPNDIEHLRQRLERQLNRSPHGHVDVTVSRDVLSFRAPTWQPLLRVRVEEALESEIGWTWSDRFAWVA